MPRPLVSVLGKTIRHVARLRGGGSALPGLVVERIDPNFIKTTLADLPMGVVVISGTNGKTTTTKMVVELLENYGLKVFTNRTGSNFTRGVAAALLKDIDLMGKLHADIAVLELDEAHAVHFVDKIPPKYSLILNVMRDQLDRFGEIDHTAELLKHIANHTTDSVVLNREDKLVADIAKSLDQQNVYYFGLNQQLLSTFPSDDNLHAKSVNKSSSIPADVILSKITDDSAIFLINNQLYETKLEITGIYNIYNAAAAITLVQSIMQDKFNADKTIQALSHIKPAFGRGEKITYKNQPIELILVKNPSGFRLGLESFPSAGHATMIAINDNYADGRDMSWLWDVDFTSLSPSVASVSGIRAYDMALRLQYDEIKIQNVDTNIKSALKKFIKSNANLPKRIFCTYTAMLSIRNELAKLTKVEDIK